MALGKNIAEVEEFSSRDVAEWMAYASIEPFGEERADLRAGIIASVIANVNRDPKKRATPFTPQDFMPFVERESAPDDMSRKLRATFAQFERA